MEDHMSKSENGQGGKGEDSDVLAKDKQRQGEAKNYSWWAESRCKEKGVPDINTNCMSRDDKEVDEDDPAREGAGDVALTEPSNAEELTEQLTAFGVDVSKFGKGSCKP